MVVVEGDEAPVGSWVKAVPPVTRPDAKLGLNDYIGRILVTSLEENITVGVVPVAIDKCAMDVFSKDESVCSAYLKEAKNAGATYVTNAAAQYGNYPYGKLVEMAKKA